MFAADTQVTTPRAERYLRALCNHFNRKVTASYSGSRGMVEFGFGTCEMNVDAETLSIHVEADNAEHFARVKHVVADHLERFAATEALRVSWSDQG